MAARAVTDNRRQASEQVNKRSCVLSIVNGAETTKMRTLTDEVCESGSAKCSSSRVVQSSRSDTAPALAGWMYERSEELLEELLMDLPDEKVLLNTSNCAEIFRVSAQVARIWKKRMIRKKRVNQLL